MAVSHAKTATRLSMIVVGMFGFGFALVPLYDLFCEVTGLGGRTGGQYEYDSAEASVDRTRLIKVNFITNTNDGMPWKFWSDKGGMRVHPGDLKEATFYVKNTTDRPMVGQAIPSVVPLRAAEHFHKTECFCFQQQVLQPGEEMAMPLRFVLGTELPPNIESVSLSYALFDVTDMVAFDVNASVATDNPG